MQEILDFDVIETFIKRFRAEHPESMIAFTNGCFDILHRGHVEYLEKAKAKADVLVVGLNSDDSVRRLKGPGRPYITHEDRAFILSRLEAVDIVCVFEQDTPLELVKRIQPDLLIKGGDYTVDNIVGKDVVEQNGGRVITIPLIAGRSTTNILEKIKRTEGR